METINFGSFPRSGNHFFVDVGNKLLKNTNIFWHEHKLFYLLEQKNAVTTIRNPVDAVHSLCFRTGEMGQGFVDNSLKWYEMYYKSISEANVLIIPFTKLVNNASACFDDICAKYSLNENKMETFDPLTIQGKEHVDEIAPKSLRKSILNSKMLYDASSIFDKLCNR